MKEYKEIFKKCPVCGSDITIEHERLLQCSSCNFHFYLAPSACCTVIIRNSKNQLLLGKRKRNPYKGHWDVIGGFIEFGETFEEAARRELLEETGIEIGELKYYTSIVDKYEYGGVIYDTLAVIFIADFEGDEFVPNDDVEELRWFDLQEIDVDNLAFDSVQKLVRDYIDNNV